MHWINNMSLPPISPSGRFVLPVSSRNSQYKFKTSCNIKILNPLIPFSGNDKPLVNHTGNKAYEVMSSIPPPSLKKSNFPVSRLSPAFPIAKNSKGYKKSTYLQQKYVDSLERQRYSEFSMAFSSPIRDYFEETLNSQIKEREACDAANSNVRNEIGKYEPGKNNSGKNESWKSESVKNGLQVDGFDIVERRVPAPEVVIQESKNDQGNRRYASFVMPPPFNNQKQIISKKILNSELQKALKKSKHSQKFMNQSLQTDVNTFEFDEWEFDYDA